MNHELLTIGDEEMKHGFPEVVNCVSELKNSRKRLFVGIFDKAWKHHTNSNEFLVKDSQSGKIG